MFYNNSNGEMDCGSYGSYENDSAYDGHEYVEEQSVNSRTKKVVNHKVSDPGYIHFSRKIEKERNGVTFLVKTHIECYSTPSSYGFKIRDAATGTRHNLFTGTWHEDLFYKAQLSTGEVPGPSPVIFFDSPEQCEKVFRGPISEKNKANWRIKNNRAIQRLNDIEPVVSPNDFDSDYVFIK